MPGKYVVLDSDRVNCRQGRCRWGFCWVDLSSEVSKVTRGDSTSPYYIKHPQALTDSYYTRPGLLPWGPGRHPQTTCRCWRQGLQPRTR
jgi:hypothetical protein